MQDITFSMLTYGSKAYYQALALREKILRAPLGLTFTNQELELDSNIIHIAGYVTQELAATASLVPEGTAVKMQ